MRFPQVIFVERRNADHDVKLKTEEHIVSIDE